MEGTMTFRRHRAASSAISFFEAHEDEIGTAAEQRLIPLLAEGETVPDVRMSLTLVRRLMRLNLDQVIDAEQDNIEERFGDIGLALELVEASEKVQQRLVHIRRAITGVYGVERAREMLAISGSTARVGQPLRLWQQGRKAVKRLRSAAGQTPPVKLENVNPDLLALADKLELTVDELQRAYGAVDLERRKLETTVDEKEKAMAGFDTDFRAGVRLAVGFCLLGGRRDLARRLKASLLDPPRRSAQGSSSTDPDEDSPSEEEETPSSDDASAAEEA